LFPLFAAFLVVTVGLSVVAEARMHAPYRGHRIVQAGTVAPPPPASIDTATGAYSFRLLRSGYLGTGPAVRLRRASDTAETDIGFDGFNNFDLATAASHCAATTCTVVTMYDQSGNTRHLTQVTPASQPSYIAACNGALPCMRTTAGTFVASAATVTPATGLVSLSAVGNRSVGTGLCAFRQNANNNRLSATATLANSWQLGATPGSISAAASDAVWHSLQGVINGASSVLSIDGTETTGSLTGTVVAGAVQIVGSAATTCNFAEFIYWDNYGLTSAERTALVANQRAFWGTP
jgi:hypothetical protein